jgi:hypothetical protein
MNQRAAALRARPDGRAAVQHRIYLPFQLLPFRFRNRPAYRVHHEFNLGVPDTVGNLHFSNQDGGIAAPDLPAVQRRYVMRGAVKRERILSPFFARQFEFAAAVLVVVDGFDNSVDAHDDSSPASRPVTESEFFFRRPASFAVSNLWHRQHNVRYPESPTCPPPSQTGRMWSACQVDASSISRIKMQKKQQQDLRPRHQSHGFNSLFRSNRLVSLAW